MSKPCKKFGHVDRYTSGGCKECNRLAGQRYRRANPRPARTWTHIIKDLGPKEYQYRRHLLRTYGMSPEQYETMFLAQGKRCAVCRSDGPGNKTLRWHIDHDHGTGVVRGILCTQCNVMIAMAREDKQVLSAGIAYLTRAACR